MALACSWAALLRPSPALANGAFPNAQFVLLPADRPRQLLVATTFGVIDSDDDGARWTYGCENRLATANAYLYLLGGPPRDRLYAVSSLGAAVSEDTGCTWKLAGGALTGTVVKDVFPEPMRPDRVFAIALPAEANPRDTLYRSVDGGLTFAATSFVAPAGATLTGVESATSMPDVVYATLDGTLTGDAPALVVSADGGETWTTTALHGVLGSFRLRLVSVDPTRPETVFLRATTPSGVTPVAESLAVTRDGGATWSLPLTIEDGQIVGFARLADGSLVVGGTVGSEMKGVLYRSTDDGVSFVDIPVSFHPRGLAARAGVLFVATDDARDTYALTSSEDGGQTWRQRLSFRAIAGVRSCVKEACQDDCAYQAGLTLFPASVCRSDGGGSNGSSCSVGLGPRGLGDVTTASPPPLLSLLGALFAGLTLLRRPRAGRTGRGR